VPAEHTGARCELSADDLGAAFDDFARPLLSYLRRRVDDDAVAEDLLSVVFLEAWRSRGRCVRVESSLAPWLYGIARNVVRNQRRSGRRHRAALDRYATTYAERSDGGHEDEVISRLDAASASAAVITALAGLSPKDRDVAELCLVDGLTANQAAVTLGLPVGTVKSRLAHARAVLRPLLRTDETPQTSDPEPASGHELAKSASRSDGRMSA
jgi:RNA polymerase sigma-70 factor, ECF subfamily